MYRWIKHTVKRTQGKNNSRSHPSLAVVDTESSLNLPFKNNNMSDTITCKSPITIFIPYHKNDTSIQRINIKLNSRKLITKHLE